MMLKLIKQGCAALLSFGLALGPAVAQTPASLVFGKDAKPDEKAVVKAVYGDFLKAHPDVQVLTGAGNIPAGLIFIKFVSKETCYDASACDTVALRKTSSSWKVVFEHSTRSLSLTKPDAAYFSEGMPTLIVDGRVRWVWSGLDHYLPEVSSLGKSFPRSAPASPDVVSAMAKIVEKTFHSNLKNAYRQSPLSLGEGGSSVVPFYWVGTYRTGLCSNDVGCPYAILYPRAGGLGVLWSGFSMGQGAVMETENQGMHDIALGTKWGYEILRYDGKKYQVVETSYPSSITPVP
jgi:hypothetical protein